MGEKAPVTPSTFQKEKEKNSEVEEICGRGGKGGSGLGPGAVTLSPAGAPEACQSRVSLWCAFHARDKVVPRSCATRRCSESQHCLPNGVRIVLPISFGLT